MAAETEQRVWRGAVPVMMQLAQDEVSVMTAPEPLYLLAPREGYLGLFSDQIRSHFGGAVAMVDDRIWLECNGKPLRWHYPAGVLYDSRCDRDRDGRPVLPWRLVVHFQRFPQDEVVSCHDEESCRQLFFNAFKEATFLRSGSVSTIMSLGLDEQQALWQAVLDLSQHRHIGGMLGTELERLGQGLRDICSSLSERQGPVRQIPVRVHLGDQTLLRPLPAEEASTVGQLLQSLDQAEAQCWVQGIKVEADIGLQELYVLFHSPDQFLHMSLITAIMGP
eukprot:TRINITY_DN3649_c0_g6_i1.p1 TRINITY_DN3649_c0_g6~~TRINITY_DN3649_c0_g6_i1.p1  ORF type:complete len:278 (-),score=43.46 TRINITY_DN3649_c0_g6_i1:364-1197(-)